MLTTHLDDFLNFAWFSRRLALKKDVFMKKILLVATNYEIVLFKGKGQSQGSIVIDLDVT